MPTDIDEKQMAKIASIVRRMTSNYPGERTTALEALGRVLESASADVLHEIAKRIEHGDRLIDTEAKEIFEAGIAKERREARKRVRVNGTFPPAHDMALFCRQRDDLLRPKEVDFINDMVERTIWRSLTQRQEEWLKGIYLRLGGEMMML